MSDRSARLQALQQALKERILILDGGMGTMIQSYRLEEHDYRGTRFADWPSDVKGNNDLLILSRPDVIGAIEKAYLDAGADILFVGLGVPKQEYWLEEHLASTGAVVGMGIGGSMDVISGRLLRAPKAWQKIGMEWLYRVIQEPARWRRIAKLPVFVWYLTLTWLHIDRYKNDDFNIEK